MGNRGKYRWVIAVMSWLAGVVSAVGYFKVPPIMPVLMETFQLTYAAATMLMTLFVIGAFVVSLPIGSLVRSLGPKKVGIVMLICLIVGSLLGCFAAGYEVLLVSRFIEGLALGAAYIYAPALVTLWFPPEELGKAMGILMTFMPVGVTVSYIVGPLLVVASWQSVWWFSTIIAIIICMLFAALTKMPQVSPTSSKIEKEKSKESSRKAYANIDIWLVAIAYFCYNYTTLAFMSWLPSYYVNAAGWALPTASLIATIGPIMMIPFGPVGGAVADKIKSMRKPAIASLALLGVTLPLATYFTDIWIALLYIIIVGIIWSFTPPCVTAAPGIILGPELAGVGLGILNLMAQLGIMIGPLVLGFLIPTGWSTAYLSLAPICFIGAILVALAKKLK
ncbi:MAG: MFS transporter [Candidatus Bathyarchaeia archaeon]